MGIVNRLSAAYKALRGRSLPFGGEGGGYDYDQLMEIGQINRRLSWLYPDTRINYAREVGDLHNSTLVMAATRWVGRNLASARLRVVTRDGDGKETEIPDDPLTAIMKRPNRFYSGTLLWRAFAFSWITAGESYLLKMPSRLGRTAELYFEPWWSIRPRWEPSSTTEFVSYYEVQRNGVWYPIDPKDVIVFRDGIDTKTRRGISATASMLREYFVDNRASGFMAQLLRNGLVPPVIVSLGTKDSPFKGDAESFAAALKRKMSGDAAGEPMTVPGTVDVQQLGFDYSKIGMKEVRNIPEERFCAAMGISAISLKLGAASEHSTLANVETYLKDDYLSYVVPLHSYIAEELDYQLMPDFGEEGRYVDWDYSETPLMQPDKTAEWGRIGLAYQRRILNRAQALDGCGYKFKPEDEEIFYPVNSQWVTDQPLTEASIPNVTTAQPFGQIKSVDRFGIITDKDLGEGEAWWRKRAPHVARNLISAGSNGHAA